MSALCTQGSRSASATRRTMTEPIAKRMTATRTTTIGLEDMEVMGCALGIREIRPGLLRPPHERV